MGRKFPGSYRRLRKPSNTFCTFIEGVFEPVRVFHSREYLALAITRHKFLPFRLTIRLCWTSSNSTEPTHQSPSMVIDHNHALTSIQCNVSVHMQCNAPFHVISWHMYNECYVCNTIHTTHRVSWIITSPSYDFIHHFIHVNILCMHISALTYNMSSYVQAMTHTQSSHVIAICK